MLEYFYEFKANLLGRSITSPKPTVRLLFWNCCIILALPVDSEIMDGFLRSRCLNNHINLPNRIRSFASGANACLVAKNGTKKKFNYC